METDNTTAHGIANDTVKQKRSKAMDMRYYWIRNRVRQKQFHIYWRKGKYNRADFHTKHHPPTHQRKMRPAYLYEESNPNRNYFQVLQEEDDDEQRDDTTNSLVEYDATGEGV